MSRNHLLALAALCVLVPGCSGAEDETANEAQTLESGPAQVETITVSTELVSEPVEAFGTIAARQRSPIGALVEGPVDRVYVNVGDQVTRGQPLFRIRQADYRRRVSEAQAAVNLTIAQATQAERQYERVMALAPRGFVSRAHVESVETDLAVARAQTAQAQAVLATAQQALSDTVARAPYDGVVTGRLIDEGVYLNNRFSTGGQSAAIELQQAGIVAAIVNAPQAHVDQFRRNLPARVFIDGFDEPFDSIVYIINDGVNPTARTVELRLPIRNPGYRISPGLSARAEIEVPPRSVMILPRSAVLGDSAAPYVFVVEGNVARRKNVETDSIDFDRVVVVSGLEEGERVVSEPPSTLRDGDQVTQIGRSEAQPDVAR
jgi:RND family efflux transporter MFP subunit